MTQSRTRGSSWQVLDYFAAGPNLTIRQPTALRRIVNEDLSDGLRAFPSDHLPVAGTLELP